MEVKESGFVWDMFPFFSPSFVRLAWGLDAG